jgi:hypothetical protein
MGQNASCCCSNLKREDFDRKVFDWKDKPFYETSYFSLFRMPLTYGSAVKKAIAVLKSKNLAVDPMLTLSGEESMFYSSLLIEMGRDDGVPVRKISGKFVSMFFEGRYRDTGKWVKEVIDYCRSQGHETKELYFFYATCPRCARHYGRAQTVIFAKIG